MFSNVLLGLVKRDSFNIIQLMLIHSHERYASPQSHHFWFDWLSYFLSESKQFLCYSLLIFRDSYHKNTAIYFVFTTGFFLNNEGKIFFSKNVRHNLTAMPSSHENVLVQDYSYSIRWLQHNLYFLRKVMLLDRVKHY